MFEVEEDGKGRLIIDSGTSLTCLDVRAHKSVKKSFCGAGENGRGR